MTKNTSPTRLFILVKHLVLPVLILAPLPVALWKHSLLGVVLSLLAAVVYYAVRFLAGKTQTACKCVRENNAVTFTLANGSFLDFRLDDMESYCELPTRGYRRNTLPHSVVVKIKGVEKPVQIAVDVLSWELLAIVKRNVKRVPRTSLCRKPSVWIDVLQIAAMCLVAASYAYVAQWL